MVTGDLTAYGTESIEYGLNCMCFQLSAIVLLQADCIN